MLCLSYLVCVPKKETTLKDVARWAKHNNPEGCGKVGQA